MTEPPFPSTTASQTPHPAVRTTKKQRPDNIIKTAVQRPLGAWTSPCLRRGGGGVLTGTCWFRGKWGQLGIGAAPEIAPVPLSILPAPAAVPLFWTSSPRVPRAPPCPPPTPPHLPECCVHRAGGTWQRKGRRGGGEAMVCVCEKLAAPNGRSPLSTEPLDVCNHNHNPIAHRASSFHGMVHAYIACVYRTHTHTHAHTHTHTHTHTMRNAKTRTEQEQR